MPITINGSTGISGVDGSTGTPAIIGSDADTGLVFSAGFISAGLNGVQARIPASYYFRLNADLAGANVNTAQNIFGVGVTLTGSTVYGIEALYSLSKTAGTTSHTIGLSFAGTATLNNILYAASLAGNLTALPNFDGSPQFAVSNSASNFQATSTAGGTTAIQNKTFIIRGTVSINAGGTFIPQYTCSAAPGGAYSTLAGSYISFTPIGAAGANVSVGTWS